MGTGLAPRIAAFFGTPRRKTYAASVGAGYVYTAVSILLNIVLIPVLLNGLGKTKFGVWLTLYALGQWVGYAVNWLSPGIVKRIGEHLARAERPRAAALAATTASGYAVVGGTLMLLALTVLPASRIGFLGGSLTADTRAAVLLAALWMAIQVQSQVRINVLHAGQRMYVVHAIQTGVVVLAAGSTIVLVLAGAGLAAVAASYAGATALGFLAFRWAAVQVLGPQPRRRLDAGVLRDLVKESTPYALSVASWALLSSDLLLLAFLTSPEEVAEYGVAYKVLEAVLQLVWRVSEASQPYVVEFNALNDRHGLRVLHEKMVRVSLILGGSAAGALLFLWEPLLRVWVGSDRFVGRSVLSLLAVYLIMQSWVHANLIFPYSVGKMRTIARFQVAEGMVKVVIASVLVVREGSIGVPVGSLVAVGLLSLWYVPRFAAHWLEIQPGAFLVRLAVRTLPVVASTGLTAWAASEFLTIDSVAALAAAAAATGVGFLVGAAMVGMRLPRLKEVERPAR